MELSRNVKIIGAVAVVAVVVLAFVWNMPIDDRPQVLVNYEEQYIESKDKTEVHMRIVNDSDSIVYIRCNGFDIDGMSLHDPLSPSQTSALRLQPFDTTTLVVECAGDHMGGTLTYDYDDILMGIIRTDWIIP